MPEHAVESRADTLYSMVSSSQFTFRIRNMGNYSNFSLTEVIKDIHAHVISAKQPSSMCSMTESYMRCDVHPQFLIGCARKRKRLSVRYLINLYIYLSVGSQLTSTITTSSPISNPKLLKPSICIIIPDPARFLHLSSTNPTLNLITL